jgi:Ni/Co efflux regulator RcnB
MKRIALALAGASIAITGLAATPAAAADWGGHDRGRTEQFQNRSSMRNGYQNNDRAYAQYRSMNGRYQSNSWQRGERFDSRYATNYRVVDNPAYYNLRPAPYGYRWVQSGDGAVLVAITSGLIGALVANAF